jgi:DNA polymerase-3 subunit delta
LKPANPLLKAIRSLLTTREFPPLKPEGVRQWIRSRAAARGVELEPKAVDTLATTIRGDLRTMATELEKLALYCWGRTVRHEDVEELVSYAKEANIFAAVDAIMEGRPEKAIGEVHRLLESGSPPAYVLSMMARQVRLLILAKELKAQRVPYAEMGQRLGLRGYPLDKTLAQEQKLSPGRLVEIHRKLLEAGLSMRTLGIGEDIILDTLIAEVSLASVARPSRAVPRRRR